MYNTERLNARRRIIRCSAYAGAVCTRTTAHSYSKLIKPAEKTLINVISRIFLINFLLIQSIVVLFAAAHMLVQFAQGQQRTVILN